MLLAPMRGNSGRKKHGELQEAREGWEEFVQTTQANFGVDMSSLTNAFTREQTQYYLEVRCVGARSCVVALGSCSGDCIRDFVSARWAILRRKPDASSLCAVAAPLAPSP